MYGKGYVLLMVFYIFTTRVVRNTQKTIGFCGWYPLDKVQLCSLIRHKFSHFTTDLKNYNSSEKPFNSVSWGYQLFTIHSFFKELMLENVYSNVLSPDPFWVLKVLNLFPYRVFRSYCGQFWQFLDDFKRKIRESSTGMFLAKSEMEYSVLT